MWLISALKLSDAEFGCFATLGLHWASKGRLLAVDWTPPLTIGLLLLVVGLPRLTWSESQPASQATLMFIRLQDGSYPCKLKLRRRF